MGFRFGFLSGFGAGYYLGARAGQQRYEQINRTLSKARRSPVVETAAEKARSLADRDRAATATNPPADLPDTLPTTDIVASDGVAVDVVATDIVVTDAADMAVTDAAASADPDDYSSSR